MLQRPVEPGQNRAQALGYESLPAGFQYSTEVQPDHVVLLIEQFLDRHKGKAPLVILDTLGKVMQDRGPGATQYSHEYRMVGEFHRLTKEHPGSTLLMLHHDRKMESEDWLKSVSGTQGISGAVDWAWSLTRKRGEPVGRLRGEGRDLPDFDVELTRTEQGTWRLAGGDVLQARRALSVRRQQDGVGDISAAILQRLSGGEPVTASELAKAAGKESSSQIGSYLGMLMKSGRIRKSSHGRYCLMSEDFESVA